MMLTRTIPPVILALAVLCAAVPSAFAEKTIDEKVDSLFVIASSLDIKYRDSVGPAREGIAALGTEAVPHLIDMLGTPHGRERAALEDIFKKIGEQAVPQLNDALLVTDSLRLSRVAKILFFFPDTSSITNLLAVAHNPYYSARYQIVRALGKIGDPRAVPTVRTAMSDTIELVRTVAAVSAGRLNDSTLLGDLLAAFDDDYYGVRMSAHEAFVNAECDFKNEFISSALRAATPRARKHLLTIISEDTCLYELEYVRPFLDDSDPLVRSLALKAAFRLDREFIGGYLIDIPDSTDSFILRQTVDDLKRDYETQTPANP